MAAKPAAAPVVKGVSIGSLDILKAGGGIPEGDYVWEKCDIQNYQATNAQGVTSGPVLVGLMITLQSMADPAAERKTQFYSMGEGASKSFAPNPVTGKGLVPIPGAQSTTINNMTNYAVLLQSLYNAGLPQNIYDDDCSVLEGMHCHMTPQAPPKEREGFRSRTAEVAADSKAPRDIFVVTEIKPDGEPWNGTGGVLGAAAPAAAKPGVAAAKPAAARPAAAAAAATSTVSDEEAMLAAAGDGITTVLEKNPDGVSKLALRMGAKAAIEASQGADMAAAVVSAVFGDDAVLTMVLGPLQYKIVGSKIVPAV